MHIFRSLLRNRIRDPGKVFYPQPKYLDKILNSLLIGSNFQNCEISGYTYKDRSRNFYSQLFLCCSWIWDVRSGAKEEKKTLVPFCDWSSFLFSGELEDKMRKDNQQKQELERYFFTFLIPGFKKEEVLKADQSLKKQTICVGRRER